MKYIQELKLLQLLKPFRREGMQEGDHNHNRGRKMELC